MIIMKPIYFSCYKFFFVCIETKLHVDRNKTRKLTNFKFSLTVSFKNIFKVITAIILQLKTFYRFIESNIIFDWYDKVMRLQNES